MVSRLQVGHAFADGLNDAGGFVSENRRIDDLGGAIDVSTAPIEGVGVAERGVADLEKALHIVKPGLIRCV